MWKNRTRTASMEPNWITTLKTSKNSGVEVMGQILSNKIKCPVLLMGNHSVIPCMIPRMTAFKISIKSMNTFPFCDARRES